MEQALRVTLESIAAEMREACDPWWIIGSAAVAIHGTDPGPVCDVDVLLSVLDAQHILPRLGVPLTAGVADGRFRSELYCQWDGPPIPIDFMAGFHVHGDLFLPISREAVPLGDAMLFLPSKSELIAILRYFGRPKDIERARLLAPATPD